MKKWARIENGKVAEIIDFDPNGKFVPSFLFIECDEDVMVGMDWDEENGFTASDELKSQNYAEFRKKEYKAFGEQLDMQYWDAVNGTTNWKDHIAEVKAKYPKPE